VRLSRASRNDTDDFFPLFLTEGMHNQQNRTRPYGSNRYPSLLIFKSEVALRSGWFICDDPDGVGRRDCPGRFLSVRGTQGAGEDFRRILPDCGRSTENNSRYGAIPSCQNRNVNCSTSSAIVCVADRLPATWPVVVS